MPRLSPTASRQARQARVEEEMHKFKTGELKSSSGAPVTDRKQAIAIAMSESGQSRRSRKKRKK